MGTIVIALEAANALLTLIGNATSALSQINAAISAAQQAGRDLTDDEMQQVIAARKLAETAAEAALKAS